MPLQSGKVTHSLTMKNVCYICANDNKKSYPSSVLAIDINNKLRFLNVQQIQAANFQLVASTKL